MNSPSGAGHGRERRSRAAVLIPCLSVLVIGTALALAGLVWQKSPTSAPLPAKAFPSSTPPSRTQTNQLVQSAPKLAPSVLDIPSLRVLAPLASEVITDNSLQIPDDVHTVGVWSGGGQVAGTTGTVLLAGHVNYYNQGNGALYDLSSARTGAVIYVSTPTGRVTTWSVSSLESYPKSELPQVIFSPTGARQLVIVTCGGPFDQATGHYVDNVVLTAMPVGAG